MSVRFRRTAKATLVLLIAAASAPLAQAPPAPDPVYDAKGFQPGRDYYSPLPFEAIDAVSGNVLLTFTDLALPGNSDLDLAFVRSYNVKPGAGNGWRFGIAGLPLVVRTTTPIYNGDTGEYKMPTFQTADGADHVTRWTPEPGNYGNGDVVYTREFWRYTRSTRRLEFPNGVVADYGILMANAGGVGTDAFLTSVSDPFGNAVALTYTNGFLSEVRQNLGAGQERVVTFTYRPGSSPLPALALPEQMTFNGGTWQYFFSDPNPQLGTLIEARPPVGPSWYYGGTPFTVTTPHGGQVTYTLAQVQMMATPRGLRVSEWPPPGQWPYRTVWMLSQRTTKAPDGTVTGTWGFQWTDLNADTARLTITAPFRTIKYECRFLWSGPVPYRRIVESGGQVVETETLQYHEDHFWAGSADQQPYPLLDSHAVTRGTKTYTTSYAYSPENFADYGHPNAITEVGDLSRTTTVTYAHGFTPYVRAQVASATVAVGAEAYTRTWTHNPATGFVTARNVYGITTTFGPDGRGNVASVTDANNHTTAFSYAWGVPKDVGTPEFSITREINPDGSIDRQTQRGFTTYFAYDAAGRPTHAYPPLGDTTITEYDNAAGRWVKTSRGSAYFTLTTLDGFGRPVATEDAAGVKTRTAYDAEGRRTYQSYPYEGASDSGDTFIYDALNRVARVTHADGSYVETAYSDGDITITDELDHGANARATIQRWRAFGDPGDARLLSLRDAAGSEWAYSYSALGALTNVDGPGTVPDRVWVYNGQHQLQSDTQPESGQTTYHYDAAGRLDWKTDARGTTVTFTYDGNNRVTRMDAPGEADDVDIWYDASNNRTRVKNGVADSTFAFDEANRTTSRTDLIAGRTFLTGYQYDGHDVLTRIDYPSGRRVDFAPGDQGRITAVTGPAATYATGIQYHPSGAITALTFANGATESVTFDSRQRPEWLKSGPLDIFYTYDAVGNVLEIDDARGWDFDSTFGYDELDRLRSVTGYGARTYTYDPAGNRLTKTDPIGAASYTYDPATQRLTWSDDTPMNGTFGYDPVGNTTSDPSGTYSYTPFNLMATAAVAGATSNYAYDGDNIRVRKVTPQGTRYYLHGAGSQVLAEYRETAGGAELVREYVYLGAKLLASASRDEAPPAGGRVTAVAPAATSIVAGNSVNVTVTGASYPCSKVDVNFGDGTTTPYTIAAPYQLPLVVSHTYAAPGLYTIVATGQAGASGPCVGAVSAPIEVTSGDVIENGDFTQGSQNGLPTGWGMSSSGGALVWDISNGLNFYRPEGATSGVVLQYTGMALPTGAPLEATFTLGNSDTVRKRATVLVHNAAFDDLAVCTFWLDPGQLAQPYTMRTHTTKAWTDATISFYAADANTGASTGSYQLNHVTMTYRPAGNSAKTDCVDPLRPIAGGVDGSTLLTNGDFASGSSSWSLTGQMTAQASNSKLEFYRISGSPAPIIAQATGTAVAPDQRLAAILELGNTSATRQRVTVTLQDASGTDFSNCVFWLAPTAPKRAYAITAYAAQAWSSAAIAVAPATVGTSGTHAWLEFDTVSLARTTQTILGTECFEPGSFTLSGGGPAPAPLAPENGPLESPDGDALALDPPPAGRADAVLGRSAAQAVVVTLAGTGSGVVTSTPAGLTCGGQGLSCTGWFPEGATVTLTATPDAGMTFVGWTSAACSGTGDCVVSVVGQQNIVALFSGPVAVTFYHLDALGSVRVVTDVANNTVKRHDYFAFGEDAAPMTGDPIRFTGKELDAETALQHFGARYLRNGLGRFTSVDPLARSASPMLPQTWNRYAYALNNPLRYVDPTGKCSAPAGIKPGQVGICIGGFIAASTIGGVGGGDNRGPTGNDPKATFRVQVQLIVDPQTRSGTVMTSAGKSVAFGALVRPGTASTSITGAVYDNKGDTHFTVNTTAKNGFAGAPLAPGDPIDMSIKMIVTSDGKVGVDGGRRDGYPSLEVYSYDSKGNVTPILFMPEGKDSDLKPPMEQRIPKTIPK